MKRIVQSGTRKMEYVLVRSKRSGILMKALPGGEIRIWAPARMGLKVIDDVVREHMDELEGMQERLEKTLENNRLLHPVEEGSRICIEGKAYDLHRVKLGRTSLRIADGVCTLSLSSPDDEEAVRAALKHTLSKLALERITQRLSVFAPLIGVRYGRVTIRDQRTRWGSCSSIHNLNFNWKLIMAPPEALDYVVIHELCHLIEFNHFARFWELVRRQMPEYEYWKKWLKNNGKYLGVGD